MNNDINKGQDFQGQNKTAQTGKGNLQEGRDGQPKTTGQNSQYSTSSETQR
jgi:hypothetical protein